MSSFSLSQKAAALCRRVLHSEERQRARDIASCLRCAWPAADFSVECFPESVAVTFPLLGGEHETYFVNANASDRPHVDKCERWKTSATLEILPLSAETAMWARPRIYRKPVTIEMLDGDALTGPRRVRMDRIRACVAQTYGVPRLS